jgi:hypothetical protein
MANRWNAPVHMVVQVPVYDSEGPNNGHFGLYGHGEQGNPGKVAVPTQVASSDSSFFSRGHKL